MEIPAWASAILTIVIVTDGSSYLVPISAGHKDPIRTDKGDLPFFGQAGGY